MRLRKPPRPLPASLFAQHLRYAREFRRHSQGEAALTLGVTQTVLSGWERQGRRPRVTSELLAALAAYLPRMGGEEWNVETIRALIPPPRPRTFARRADGAFSRAAPPTPAAQPTPEERRKSLCSACKGQGGCQGGAETRSVDAVGVPCPHCAWR